MLASGTGKLINYVCYRMYLMSIRVANTSGAQCHGTDAQQ